MKKGIVKRLYKIEKMSWDSRWRLVLKDSEGVYSGECGDGLSEDQFKSWISQQDKSTQIIVVELSLCQTKSGSGKSCLVRFEVKNYVSGSTGDILKGYEQALEEAARIDIRYKCHKILESYPDLEPKIKELLSK